MKTCRSGLHTYEGNKGCQACAKLNHKTWVASNLIDVRAREKKWRETNRVKFLTSLSVWHRANDNPILERERLRVWAKQNPGKVMAKVRKYQASKINATPTWLTEEQLKEIQNLYVKASELKCHVDHIVPLRGKTICGLHVPWNLQLLTKEQNLKKGNRL